MERVYLSAGFFTDSTRIAVSEMAKILRVHQDYDVYVPMEYFVPDGENMPNDKWAAEVFKHDVEELDKCDKVVYLDFGASGDCGAAWEVGYAYAKGIPVEVYAYGKDISLMVTNCATRLTKMFGQELKLV